jgi:hypothetical protein
MGEWMYRSTYSWPRHYSWRWVVRFTHWPLYPRYTLDRMLGGPPKPSGRRGEKFWPYRDSNSYPSSVQPVASRYTDWAIACFECMGVIFWRCHYLSWSYRGTIPGLFWRDWGKSWRISVRIVHVSAKILTEHLPNTSLELYCCGNSIREWAGIS